MQVNMKCKYCKGPCIKSGITKTSIQRYLCKSCVKYQQKIYTYSGCKKNIHSKIEQMNNEGCGIRSISRILKISTGTVLTTIKHLWKEKLKSKKAIVNNREYELDEMRTFIGNKNQKFWIVYAIDRITREVVDFRVGKRNKKTLKQVVDTLLFAKAKKIYTDKLNLYQYLIPPSLHERSQHKTNHIERKNLSIRTHLKRLSRKTICYSKSIGMLEATLGLYFRQTGYLR